MKVLPNSFDRMWAQCNDDVLAATARVGASGWYILGREVEEFERAFSKQFGHTFAVGCGNGMDALEISLRASGIREGDHVLTSPLSAFATALAILRAGGVPVFCDIDSHGLLDPQHVEACCNENKSIKFVIPVHLYGFVADMSSLRTICDRNEVILIEDAAQAVGGRRGQVHVGRLSHATCYSFYPTKNLGALGDGGAIGTDVADIDRRARTLRNYGQSKQYEHTELGLNSRLDELHASILHQALLPRVAEWTSRRREVAMRYLSEISHPAIELVPGPDVEGSVWHLFPVLAAAQSREVFMEHLRNSGVQPGQHYPQLIPHQRALTKGDAAPIIHAQLDNAKRFVEQEVSLPINPFLSDAEVGYVIQTVNDWPG